MLSNISNLIQYKYILLSILNNVNLCLLIKYNLRMIINNISTIIGMRKMTISETAKLAGIAYNTVYNLYYNKTSGIDFQTIDKLCKILDCTTNDLIRYIPD